MEDEIIKTPDFKNIVDVIKYYDLSYKKTKFIDYKTIIPLKLDDWFLEDLNFALLNVSIEDKESFMCEFVIVPFLRKVWKMYNNLYLFSHVYLKSKNYNVIPDYLITAKNKYGFKYIEKPLLVTVEAKFEKFNEGWFQATMQMLAAQELNDNKDIPIYGIVTTGSVWQFGKLENNILYQHPDSVSIENPEHISGILAYVFGECNKIAEKMYK